MAGSSERKSRALYFWGLNVLSVVSLESFYGASSRSVIENVVCLDYDTICPLVALDMRPSEPQCSLKTDSKSVNSNRQTVKAPFSMISMRSMSEKKAAGKILARRVVVVVVVAVSLLHTHCFFRPTFFSRSEFINC